MAKKAIAAKKRVVKIEGVGQLHVMSSFNNVIVTVANGDGQVISWSSAGKQGFRGSKKNTPYAAQMAAADCCKVAYDGYPCLRRCRYRCNGDRRCDSDAAQRLPSSETSSCIINSINAQSASNSV